jgi:large subunit ribosomal protein L25
MVEVVLSAQVRTGRGKGYRRRLAAQGKIPAVVYGKAVGNLMLEISLSEMKRILANKVNWTKLLDLRITGEGWDRQDKVIIKEVQYDPLTGNLRHVDFHQVSLGEEVTVTVPVELRGEPVGVKKGGVLQHQLRAVEVSCLPTQIPEVVTVDVSGMDIGDTLFVRDLSFPAGVKVLSEPEEEVVTVLEGTEAEEEG